MLCSRNFFFLFLLFLFIFSQETCGICTFSIGVTNIPSFSRYIYIYKGTECICGNLCLLILCNFQVGCIGELSVLQSMDIYQAWDIERNGLHNNTTQYCCCILVIQQLYDRQMLLIRYCIVVFLKFYLQAAPILLLISGSKLMINSSNT